MMNAQAMIRTAFLALVLLGASSTPTFAQELDEAALAEAIENFKGILDQVDNLFYKEQTADNGSKYFIIVWDMDGETSKLSVEFRYLGDYRGKPVFGILSYMLVAQTEGSFPPAVIKAVVNKNDKAGIGTFSMPEAFDAVFLSHSAPCETMTPGQVWMVFAYMHQNRVGFRNEIQELMQASGR